jgi:hypothetical protein
MKFSLFVDFGALNSKPVFEAFDEGAKRLGHTVVYNSYDADVAVIWSVLFNGRMKQNQDVYTRFRKENKPVIVLEVGAINRGTTWKVGINGIDINSFPLINNNRERAELLKLKSHPWNTNGKYILICGQNDKSLQWKNMPSVSNWMISVIDTLQQNSDREIIIRPHPRCPLPAIEHYYKKVYRATPTKIVGTYDNFDLNFENIYATVNWSSNPGILSALNGIPTFTGPLSLAAPVSMTDLASIENLSLVSEEKKQQWTNDLAYTEWTVEEIKHGKPLIYLTF